LNIDDEYTTKTLTGGCQMMHFNFGLGVGFNIIWTALILLIETALLKYLWGQLMPYLFPRVVSEGYVRRELSWAAAFGLILLFGFIL
jgi:hypothetical protein